MNNKYVSILRLDGENTFLYNLLTRAKVILPYKIRGLEDIDLQTVEILRDAMVLHDEISERTLERYIKNKIKYMSHKLHIIDSLTFNCNLKCKYCIQQNTHTLQNGYLLSPEERFKIWDRLYSIMQPSFVHINLFGGEPLLSSSYLEELLEIASKSNIPIKKYTMTSNGTLVTDEVVRLINRFPIKNLMITLDGPAFIHDERRVTNTNQPTWGKIVSNIERLLKETSVNIIINTVIDISNAKYYKDLLDSLIEKFSQYIFAETGRMVFNISTVSHPDGHCAFTEENTSDDISIAEYYIEALEYAVSQKVKLVQFPAVGAPLCTFKREYEIIVSPDGSLYKCISAIGVDNFKICDKGILFNQPEKFLLKLAHFVETEKIDEECMECMYKPICEGGCHYNAHVTNAKKECQKSFYQHIWPRLLKVIADLEPIGTSNIYVKKF